jgi:hypothetical protein
MPTWHTSLDEWNPHERLLTIAQAAKSIERPESTIRRWLTQGLRVYSRLGHRPLILEADLLTYEALSASRERMKHPRDARTSGGLTDYEESI